MESLLSCLADREIWEEYFRHKKEGVFAPSQARELREFIDNGEYIEVCREIADVLEEKAAFPLPRKALISKMSTQKKRTVYIYPRKETLTLKLLTYLILRKYDHIFADVLYSFRPGRSARTAVNAIREVFDGDMYSYKVDISNYFNSVDVDVLLPSLESILDDDPLLFAFLKKLLTEPGVVDGKSIAEEKKGIMAGTPIACFFANVFLMELDRIFEKEGVIYARYSDDIIVCAGTREELSAYAKRIRVFLEERGLKVNPDKEVICEPGEAFSFLGFSMNGDTIDIAPATVMKLKRKMRRKARSLIRWASRNDIPPENAAKAFIRIFNRKLLDISDDHDLTWSYWFFSVINTDQSLKVIDHYAQDTIRYIASGTRTKARFNVRYEDLKAWGYKSLVAEYYGFCIIKEQELNKGR